MTDSNRHDLAFREAFMRYVEQRVTTFSGVTGVQRSGDLRLTVQRSGDVRTFDLEDAYSAYRQDPDSIEFAIQDVMADWTVAAVATPAFEAVRDHIMPMLKPLEVIVGLPDQSLIPVYLPFSDDLIITYVVAHDAQANYVTMSHVQEWLVDPRELHMIALENLHRHSKNCRIYLRGNDPAHVVFIVGAGDGFDATRILLPELFAPIEARLLGRTVVGIPHRDLLLIFSDADPQIFAEIVLQVQQDALNHEHGLTDQLFMLSNGRIVAYDWE